MFALKWSGPVFIWALIQQTVLVLETRMAYQWQQVMGFKWRSIGLPKLEHPIIIISLVFFENLKLTVFFYIYKIFY